MRCARGCSDPREGLNHVSESSKKHGEVHGNWGNVASGEEALEAEVGPVPTLPGEQRVKPPSDGYLR